MAAPLPIDPILGPVLTHRRPRSKRPQLTAALTAVIVVFLAGSGWLVVQADHATPATAEATTVATAVKPTATPAPTVLASVASPSTTSIELEQQLTDIITAQSKLDVEVQAISLKTGHVAGVDDDQQMVAASTMKLIVAATVLDQVDRGKLKLTRQVGGTTLKEQLRLMIQQSNNDAWAALNNLVGLATIQKYAQSQKIAGVKVNGNKIAPAALGRTLQLLYQKELLSPESTELLLSYMHPTNEERLLPAALPDFVVYHKYGWIDTYVHDAAIVDGPEPFVLVVMTSGNLTIPQRQNMLKQLSAAVVTAVQSGW